MISSGPSIASGPPHPEAAERETEAGDDGLPKNEAIARPEVACEDERGKAEADRGERPSEPQSDDRIAEHEQRRPEGHRLAWAELSEEIRPDPAEGVEEGEGGESSERKAGGGHVA